LWECVDVSMKLGNGCSCPHEKALYVTMLEYHGVAVHGSVKRQCIGWTVGEMRCEPLS